MVWSSPVRQKTGPCSPVFSTVSKKGHGPDQTGPWPVYSSACVSPRLRRWTVDSSRSCRDTDACGTVAITIIRIRRRGVGWETLVNCRVSLGVLPPVVIITVPLCFFLNRSGACCLYGLYVSPLRFDCDGVYRPYSLLGFLLGFSPVSVRDSLCAHTTLVGSLRIGRVEWAGYAGPPSFLGSAMAFIACAVYGVLLRALTAIASEPIRCLGVPSLFWCEGR